MSLPRRWVLLLALPALACGGEAARVSQPPPPAERPSVVLISVDTLRADRLGCYGGERPTSPRLDALATEGVVYDEALAPTPWTLPSHAALLTGIHPWTLGVVNQWRSLPSEAETLAQRLAATGYHTAAFVDSLPRGFVGAERGFDRGFEVFEHAPHDDRDPDRRYDVAATVDAGVGWLEERGDDPRPFFLFLHTRSVHAVPTDEPCRDPHCAPYDQPEPFRERFSDERGAPWRSPDDEAVGQAYLWWLNEGLTQGSLDRDVLPTERLEELVALYDAGIFYTDHHLGRLFDALDAAGLSDSTWVVVTSDHGESFLEHDLLMHQEVYRETLRVPLIVRPPHREAISPQRVPTPVALEDVAVSILDWAGAPTGLAGAAGDLAAEDRAGGGELPLALEGRTLPGFGPAAEASEDREFFAYYLFPEKFDYRAFALRREGHVLVTHNFESLAGETEGSPGRQLLAWGDEHRSVDDPQRLDAMVRSLRRRVAEPPKAIAEHGRHREQALGVDLETLGYID